MRFDGGQRTRIFGSLGRILLLLAVVLGGVALAYGVWAPGADFQKSSLDRGENAIWLGHGWLGDDSWFRRNRRNPEDFRTEEHIRSLLSKLQENRIRFVYPHLCPAGFDGGISPYDSVQVERFLEVADEYGIVVIPWIGGVFEESACPDEIEWRGNFVDSIAELLYRHPRIGGVQINIEPMPSGNRDFLTLLKEIRPVLNGRILSVAAYPPPTRWHQFPDVHWTLPYQRQVAQCVDQMAVMMYDTAIKLDKFYIQLMCTWTEELQDAVAGTDCKLLLGVPAYEDADVDYHHPGVENMENALRGIHGAVSGGQIAGIAIYCEWEMTPEKWDVWAKMIRKNDSIPSPLQ